MPPVTIPTSSRPARARLRSSLRFTRVVCAAFTCSSLWNGGGKSLADIERDELTGIYPEIEGDVRASKADVDDQRKRVSVRYRDDRPPRIAEWNARQGCVTLPIVVS